MADWSLPNLTTGYVNFLTYLSDRLNDAATMFSSAPANPPTNSIRYNRTTNLFEQYDGANWNPLQIGLGGGGTSGTDAPTARTALGLGTMALQNATAVAITGGTITGTNVTFLYSFLSKAANYSITAADIIARTIFLCTGAGITMTLPTTNDSTIDGLPVNIKNLDTSNSVIIATTGGDTIDGASTITLPPGFSGGKFNYTMVCNKASGVWEII